jgi:hypothetical protein
MRAKALALALVLLWGTGARAAMDFNGTTGKAESSVVEVTNEPLTIACWGKQDILAVDDALSITDTASDTQGMWSVTFRGTFDDKIGASVFGGGTFRAAVTSTTYSAGTWRHGAGVFTGNASIAALLDGAGKGTNVTGGPEVAGIDSTAIGVRNLLTESDFFDGSLAECGIWNVALTDGEIAILAKGFAPPCVRRASLVAYYPMVRDTTSLKDLFSATANNLTLAGTTAVADHPRINNCQ